MARVRLTRWERVKDTLTYEDIRAALNYDPETGILTWKWRDGIKNCINARYAGKEVGNFRKDGYRETQIDGHMFLSHRAAWIWMTGQWPVKFIDHIDGNPANNRWVNLREASHQENSWNHKISKANKSGFTGVFWSERLKKYYCYIRIDGKQHRLGWFTDPIEASKTYKAAANQHFGKFARVPHFTPDKP